jgi:urease accessory protein UreF
MPVDERNRLEDIRHATFDSSMAAGWESEDEDDDRGAIYHPNDSMLFDEVLQGERVLETSHHGGEFLELLQQMTEDLKPKRYALLDITYVIQFPYPPCRKKRRKENRTRRDRTARRWDAFKPILSGATDAYMRWYAARSSTSWEDTSVPKEDAMVDGHVKIQVLDIFCESIVFRMQFLLILS